ncbi:single-stranded DNA-binding protein [Enterococcus faecalis]|uniref:single-stranded DNA-binding protein n=1 Tax=Enterococcus faecalis TaxID=1351 RepID=UPI001D1807D0|nr:single-stranded DNA-binding protein [Enterococcus faecalis]MCC4085744.1 single-stranded DNA-binding protein [Enterococcus faecalis]
MNNVTLVGRLTKDPDLRYTQSGTAVGQFTLAVNRNFTNQQGDREEDFINCVIWRKAAESFANYARKGTLIGLTGRIQTRNYDEQRRSSKPEQATFDKQATDKPDPLVPFSKDVSPIDISDDDLPF